MSTLVLTPRIGWLTVTSSAILTHIIFNRLEPRKPSAYAFLLIGTPLILAIALHPLYSSMPLAIIHIYWRFISILLSSLTLYRLSPLHPLAKFPGPFINKITSIRMLMVARTRKRHMYLKSLHETYGPFVRIGPNVLSIVDVDAIQPVLGSKGMPKGEVQQMFLPNKSETSLMTESNPVKHAEFRKAWHRGFTPTALKGYDDIILKRLQQLVDTLGQQDGVVDFGKWVSYYKFDLMGDLVFGGGFEMMKDGGDQDRVWAILLDSLRVGTSCSHIPWIGSLLRLFHGQHVMPLTRLAVERVNIRIRSGSITRDLFYHFSEEDRAVGKPPSLRRLGLDGMTAIIAASDTTSSTITGVFYHILRYPEVFERLRQEIDTAFDHEDINNQDKLADLPYLNACIDETLRVMPPLPSMLSRQSKVETIICGRVIPPNTGVIIPLYTLLRDPRYFSPSPDAFQPERWLNAQLGEKANDPAPFTHNLAAFIPFSFGPANCIGKQLAYREMRLLVATLVRKFDFQFADGYNLEKYIDELKDDFVLTKGELPVILTKRL